MSSDEIVTKTISTKVFPIGSVCEEISQGLTIPSIQRDYKWGPGHDDDEELNSAAYVFLEDMLDFHSLRQEDDIYFTGTMIVFEESTEPRTQLMDGQQRWTTVTVLMSVIRHLLLENQDNHLSTITDIQDRFLTLRNGHQMLESRKKDDRKTILKLVRIAEGDKLATILPPSLKNNFTFKRSGVTYNGTSINCVAEYFHDRLKEHFKIRGSQSEVSDLIDFYQTITSHVYLNYSHTMSPNLAYKMFVTANSRGTPLNNFDVFRGLVLSHCRIKRLGGEVALQEILDTGDAMLQEYVDVTKRKDFGKTVDKVMSESITVLEGKKISAHHVMSRLEHRISSITSLEELSSLIADVCGYIEQLLRIAQQKGKNGRVQHLRMNSFGFTQHIPYYAAARQHWGEGNELIPQLLDCIEIIVTRRLILQGKNISKLFYAIAPKHLASISSCQNESEQETALKAIQKNFSDANDNPTDFEIAETLKFRQFDLDRTGDKNKLIAALVCLEPERTINQHEFQTTQKNPKVTCFMPKYNHYSQAFGFDYPEDYNQRQIIHGFIGNCFLLNSGTTGIQIKTFNENQTALTDRRSFIKKRSNKITTSQNLASSWDEASILERTKRISEALISRFPQNCVR